MVLVRPMHRRGRGSPPSKRAIHENITPLRAKSAAPRKISSAWWLERTERMLRAQDSARAQRNNNVMRSGGSIPVSLTRLNNPITSSTANVDFLSQYFRHLIQPHRIYEKSSELPD